MVCLSTNLNTVVECRINQASFGSFELLFLSVFSFFVAWTSRDSVAVRAKEAAEESTTQKKGLVFQPYPAHLRLLVMRDEAELFNEQKCHLESIS